MIDILTTEIPVQIWNILSVIIIIIVIEMVIKKRIPVQIWNILIAIIIIIAIIGIGAVIKNGLGIDIDIPNLIVSVCLLLVTANLYNYQNDTLKSENTPYPYISAILAYSATPEELENINIRNPINSDGNPVITWYYYGKQEAKYFGKDIEDIGIELIEKNPEDRKIINEIKNNEGSICFSKINDHNCILFINEDIKSSFIFEYSSSVIDLKNYGASFHNLQLESFSVFFDEPHGKSELTLSSENTEQKNIPLIVESGDTIQVICCQVTHNLINSQCITSEDVIHELGNSYDLLTKRIPDNAFNYDKVEIIISCENFLNEKFRYKLILEKQGYYYISKTELLDK